MLHNSSLYIACIDCLRTHIIHIDSAIFKLVNGGLGSPILDPIMKIATQFGEDLPATGFCLFIILIGIICSNRLICRAGWGGILAWAIAGTTSQILKHLIDRPRPLLVIFDVRLVGDPLFAHSFPSGHTSIAFACAIAISILLPRLRYMPVILAVLTGISRMYLGVHFPLDVLGGAIIGIISGTIAAKYISNKIRIDPKTHENELLVGNRS